MYFIWSPVVIGRLDHAIAIAERVYYLSRTSTSAVRFLHKRSYLGLVGSRHLLQRERDRPHGAFVEVRWRVEAEHHVPIIVGRFRIHPKVAHDFVVPGIWGQAIPGFRRE